MVTNTLWQLDMEKTCQQSGITESAIRLHLIPEVKQKLNLTALQNFHDQFF